MIKTVTLLVTFLAASCFAEEKIATPAYWSAAGVTASATFLDAYTSITDNPRICPNEISGAWLYSTHTQQHPLRVSAIMAGEVILGSFSAYELKKHHRRWWIAPLAYTTAMHTRGAVSNFANCR